MRATSPAPEARRRRAPWRKRQKSSPCALRIVDGPGRHEDAGEALRRGTPARPPKGGSSAWSRGGRPCASPGCGRGRRGRGLGRGRAPPPSSVRRTRGAFAKACCHGRGEAAPRSARRSALGERLEARVEDAAGSQVRHGAPSGAARRLQPALAALVELEAAVARRAAAAAEVELLHVLVRAQLLRLAVEDDPAALHDVAVVRRSESARFAFCSTRRKVVFSSRFTRGMIAKISRTRSGARPSDGSSRRMSLGRAMSARLMASICCSPPER